MKRRCARERLGDDLDEQLTREERMDREEGNEPYRARAKAAPMWSRYLEKVVLRRRGEGEKEKKEKEKERAKRKKERAKRS